MKYYFYLALMMISLASPAQVWEDFSDEDLELDPAWQGEPEKFKFSSSSAVPAAMRPALQLNSEGEGSAFLSFESATYPAMQWEFWLKMSFNTSASNFARLYLSGENTDPADSARALFIQAGGAADSVWFGKADSTGDMLLFMLPGMFTGNSTNALRMKVIRETDGTWRFYGNANGDSILDELGEYWLNDSLPGDWFSIYCRHTSSNASKFYFDDIYCGPMVIDSAGPLLQSARMVSSSEILLGFNEALLETTAGDTANYLLSHGKGHPYSAFRMLDPTAVMLFYEDGFVEEQVYLLNIENLEDLSGNRMKPAMVDLSWYTVKPWDVVINEIMADPSPAAGLPEYEYVELYNRTGQPLDLTGWDLEISGSGHVFPESTINPQGYLLLLPEEALPVFQFCGPAVGFPSFSISNEGAGLLLKDTAGTTIGYTDYQPALSSDPEKEAGGWSMERVDPAYPCVETAAWQYSIDASGGTPGRENSHLYPLDEAPGVEMICCPDSFAIRVRFSHAMDPRDLADPSLYVADKGLGHPVAVEVQGDGSNEAVLTFSSPLVPGLTYRLEVAAGFRDCIRQPADKPVDGIFSLPSDCEPFDLVFNEILFHPLATGAEYIEFYNRSDRTLHLDELILAYIREVPPNPPDTERYWLSESCLPCFPGSYAVLTKYPEKVASAYPENLHRMDPFPSLNNEMGRLLLLDGAGNTIDGLDYSAGMHYPLLNSFAGVALERICPDVPGTQGNWHSASSVSGFGTPGAINSQYLDRIESENVLELTPPVFSPDGDGRDDVLGISCHFEESGMRISILVFSADGRLARRLVAQELAGTENQFAWDGLTDGGYPATDGIYIVLVECMSLEGYSRSYKKVAVVVSRN